MANKNTVDISSISDNDRIETLLAEVNLEIEALTPHIEALEEQLAELRDLKSKKQKLLALKLSLDSVLKNFTTSPSTEDNSNDFNLNYASRPTTLHPQNPTIDFDQQVFFPDKAFEETKHLLKKKGSLNYELYRAIVFNGGKATTEEIRQYLIDHKLTLPSTGETFDTVSLTQVSSRVNYLVRKGIIQALGRGHFASNFGWDSSSL